MTVVHHHTVLVDGLEVFWREAGPADAPVPLLAKPRPARNALS